MIILILIVLIIVAALAWWIRNRRLEELERKREDKNYQLKKVIEGYREGFPHLFDPEEAERWKERYLSREGSGVRGIREELEDMADPHQVAAKLEEKLEDRMEGGVKLGRSPTVMELEDELGKEVGRLMVGIPEELRKRHTYVIGKTGYGKTNLLRQLIHQDLQDGYGLGVISPEAELARDKILPFIPEERLDEVIYFNPEDEEKPVTFNPFHLGEGEDLNKKAQRTFTILEEAMPNLTGARMRPILKNSVYTLVEKEGATILDLEKLLDPYDSGFREEVIEETNDERTRKFWQQTYPSYPENAHLPIINRLDQFLRPPVSRILGHPTGSLRFRRAMDQGKILLFNLSTGILGEKVSQVLGQLIVANLQQALVGRDKLPESQRKTFYLYIDEFQTYTETATSSYSEILARARKYGMGLILAHQQTKQVPGKLLADIFGNVSTMISFNLSASDAGRVARELTLDDPDYLTQLDQGRAWARIGQTVFGLFVPLFDLPPDWGLQKEAIKKSRENYGVSMDEFEPGEGTEREDRSARDFLE